MPLPGSTPRQPRQKTLHLSLPGDSVKLLRESAYRKRVPVLHLCRYLLAAVKGQGGGRPPAALPAFDPPDGASVRPWTSTAHNHLPAGSCLAGDGAPSTASSPPWGEGVPYHSNHPLTLTLPPPWGRSGRGGCALCSSVRLPHSSPLEGEGRVGGHARRTAMPRPSTAGHRRPAHTPHRRAGGQSPCRAYSPSRGE